MRVHFASFTPQQIGSIVWNVFMAAAGIGLAATGPKYLHLIDKGFPAKQRSNPVAAARQVRTFRILGAAMGLCSLTLVVFELLGVGR